MSLQAEKMALGLILGSLRKMGWEHYELDDGDGWEFVGDKSTELVVEDCAAVEMCTLRMLKDGDKTAVILIVWGNSPSELIADHSCSRGFDDDVDAALKAIWPEWPFVEGEHETEEFLRVLSSTQPKPTPAAAKTQEQYVEEGGTFCPYCGSRQLEGGSVTVDAGEAWQGISCNDCGAAWQDQYKLVGYQPEEG